MLKQVVILQNPYYVSCKQVQLYLHPIDSTIGNIDIHIPIEDIALLLIDNPQITLSSTIISELLHHNCVLIHCDKKHMPIGTTLTMVGNHLYQSIIHSQINLSLVRKKQLWQRIIIQKIINQGALLKTLHLPYEYILSMSKKVRSADESNLEAQSAKRYWKELFSNIEGFRRSRDGIYPNNFLNYGYAILRAACARALVGSGLSVALGIHHHNQYNAYCLVDDIIEPYRPFIDNAVYKLIMNREEQELIPEIKKYLIDSLYQDVKIGNRIHPLLNGLTFTSSSLVHSIKHDNVEELVLPEFPDAV